ncbi:hypothetical protein ARMGADRAFT_882892, partial [Armillaria gallica]
KLCFKIIHSSTLLLPHWKALLQAEGLPEKVLPHDVLTHWNSMFDMLLAVLHHQVVLKKFTADVDNDLHEFELSREEWKAVLKDATLYFSCSGTPNLATVILAMDMINKVLAMAAVNDMEFSAPIWSSLLVAKQTLNRYYCLTDDSDLYRIAMILHPVHKTQYFE